MDQSLFSAPHDLSQSITSFIASYCQGIHQTPFSRLIWSRKSKVSLNSKSLVMQRPFCKPQTIHKPKPHGNRLVSPFPSIPGQKSYFSRPLIKADICVIVRSRGLVYLTWTTLFISACRPKDVRGSTRQKARVSPKASAHYWDHRLTRRDQTVLFVTLRLILE